MDDRDQQLSEILAQAAWIRRLACRLVSDASERDDVLQQVWLAALETSPRAQTVRPWLLGVLRNVARMQLRSRGRRRHHEQSVEQPAAPTPEALVERLEIERELADALLELAEPYRSTLLLRYQEDLSAAEIARRLNLPAGTVRWRLKQGLDQLRDKLDRRAGGDRRRWSLALVPTAAGARGGIAKAAVVTIGGALIMKATTKIAAAVVLLLLLLAGGLALWRHTAVANDVSRAQPGVAWRMPGGIGATATSPPTVAGVAVPAWFGQRGAPVRRIAGRVTFAGEPVANATVELASELTDAGLLAPAKRRTGVDGRFDFGTQPPAKLSVAATADGHSAAIVDVDARDPTSNTERIELRLGGCESVLFGHVNDSSGGPIAGAQVCLAPPRASACTSASSDGAYTMCLHPLLSLVTVGAAGYGAIHDRFEYVGHRVQRDYALMPEASIVGRVVRADNNAPVVGASVRVSSTEFAQRFAAPGATTTNEQGRFTIGGLASGRYRIVAFAERLAAAEGVEINIEAGRPSGEVLLRLIAGARLSGVVTDGRDPIVGATVSLGVGQQPGAMDAVTQSDGSFVLDPVGRGIATLAVRQYDLREPKTVHIDRPEVSGVRLLVDVMGSIAGRVTAQGKPLAGGRVSWPPTFEATYADADGNYVVHGLPQGRYHVFAEDPTTRAFGDHPADVMLAKGEHRTGVDVDVRFTAKISGVVVETDGKPLGGVAIGFQSLHINDGGQDVTAPDGTFCVRNLKGSDDYRAMVFAASRTSVQLKIADAGDSRLTPTAAGNRQGPTVNVKDGITEVTGVRIVVQRDHLSIVGTTVDGDGQPLSDVRVMAFRSDDPTGAMLDDRFEHANAISTASGSYAIDNLDEGSYVLRARGGDGSEGIARGVAAGQKNVVVTLQRAGAIDGTLIGFSSPPAVGAVRQLGASFTSVFATVDGTTFHFRGLSPGSYQVAAVGAETDAKLVEVAAGQTASATLQSRGAATIRGRVVDWAGGAGVAGMRCVPGLHSSPGMPMWLNSIFTFSDENGGFVLEGAPTGDIAVGCFPVGPYWSNGWANLTLGGGQDATCEVPVVKMNPDAPMAQIGATLEPGFMPAHFNLVAPHGPADRAGIRVGDVIATVDGATATRLTPWGVTMLIGLRAPGSTVHLGLSRGAQMATADLVIAAP